MKKLLIALALVACLPAPVVAQVGSSGIAVIPARSAYISSTGVAAGPISFPLGTTITEDAANTLAQRNGTTAQAFRLYETFTDPSNYSRVSVRFDSSLFRIGPESAGTGIYRSLVFNGASLTFATGASGGATADRWTIDASGHLLPSAHNTYDYGSNATRPKTGYFGTSVVSPAYTVGSTAGASGTCAAGVATLTVVNGIVTAITCI